MKEEPAEIIRSRVARLAARGPGMDPGVERTAAARAADQLSNHLQPDTLPHVGDALIGFLELPLSGTCSPRCCDASAVRARQIQARVAVLRALHRLARLAPAVTDAFVATLSPTLVAALAAPGNRRLALPTVELLAACPGAARQHVDTLVHVLSAPADAHRWPVREAAVRALGRLRLAPRRSEHVACAGGGRVLAAGEVCVREGAILSVTNQSTGYCPEPRCFPAVRDALAAAGVPAPARWTHAFTFRRCGCGQINLIKDEDYTCGVCGRDLPEEWNFG